MTTQRWFVLTAFTTAACALTGLGALAAGAAFLSGTDTEAEREVALFACVLGFLSGGLLLALSTLRANVLGRAAAAGAFIAALAFAVPAVLAFAATVNTPTDDSLGCGSISTPNKTLVVRGARPEVTPTCQDRITKQKLLVSVLALPTIGAAGSGLLTGLRSEARRGEPDS
jgi:hypothetical protein